MYGENDMKWGEKGEMYGEIEREWGTGGQLILAHSPGGILARRQSHCIGLDRCVQIPHVVLPGAALGDNVSCSGGAVSSIYL